MTSLGAKIVEIARAQVGTTEQPPYSNSTPYGAYFGREPGPWCAYFVSWCFASAGAPLPDVNGPRGCFSYCPAGQDYATRHGEAVRDPQPGDIVLFDFYGDGEPCHVGLFVGWRPDGSLETIEGNTSDSSAAEGDAVRVRRRWPRQVSCYWRPKVLLDGAAQPEEPDLKPASAPSVIGDLPARVLGPGATGADVEVVQRFLSVAGLLLKAPDLDPGGADGSFGPKTKTALQSWQRTIGVQDDGEWGPATLRASNTYARDHVPEVAIGRGSTGSEVVKLQRLLRRIAEVFGEPQINPGQADGDAGPATAAAMRRTEQVLGRPDEGVIDTGDLIDLRRKLETEATKPK